MDSSILLFMNIGGPEMILIFLVVLLLFGGKKLPELARGLGKGLREFKDASDGIKREIHNNINAVTEAADMDKVETKTENNVSTETEKNVSTETDHSVSTETDHSVSLETEPKVSIETPEPANTEHTKIVH